MHTFLLLVIALGGGDWSCTETEGLWDCRPTQALPAPRRVVPPARPVTAQSSPPVAPLAAPQEAPREVPQESPQAVPQVPPATAPALTAPAAPASQAAEPSAPLPPDRPPSEDSAPPEVLAAFIVQIGAYRRRGEAQQAADALGYADLAIVPTQRDDKTWYVLLLGAFRTLDAARAAGDAYETRTGGSYWVRTGEDLQQSLRKAQPAT